MEDLDLDAFIANIEQTAPQENLDDDKLRCQECGATLEEIDESYVCPNCSAQATNILQLEETELHYDETGRAIVGQRVNLTRKKSKHSIDYGWAWSTDDAIVHILALQITALEKAHLVPDHFREALTNMWFKFWLENVAPFIKDEYDENELIPIDISKALKLRDIEVLVKVKDKVMVPSHLFNHRNVRRRSYKMLGSRFYAFKPDSSPDNDSDSSSSESSESLLDASLIESALAVKIESENNDMSAHDLKDNEHDCKESASLSRISKNADTRDLSIDTISILTLNRTLAFIEATARCINQSDPLFAADIIRACNQHLIPFYGAFKTLPDGMKLNPRDKLMFQKTKPPTPIQLTRAASLLIHKIYHDRLPISVPVPNLNAILRRFIKDMNLPSDLLDFIKDKVSFSNFKQTQTIKLVAHPKRRIRHIPQYDRWAFAILLGHLKNLFSLDDQSIVEQTQIANIKSNENGERFFALGDWLRQMNMRLKIILSYDPFVLFHPLTQVKNLETTPQVYEYLETFLSHRVTSTTRTQPNLLRFEESFRIEFAEFLIREIAKPPDLKDELLIREELDKSANVKYPIQDSIRRTKRFWFADFSQDEEASSLIFRDFSQDKMLMLERVPKWILHYNAHITGNKPEISPNWPDSFKLLLSVGAFLCLCEPEELLKEVRVVEEFMHPHARVIKRRQSLQRKAE